MPLATEKVPNRALSADEVKVRVRADLEKLMAGEGLLAPHVAYRRVAYELRFTIHTDNAYYPVSKIERPSQPENPPGTLPDAMTDPVERFPMAAPGPDSMSGSVELHREIDSPNAERLRLGLPIPVDVQQPDGTRTVEHIQYPPDETIGEGTVTIRDSSDDAKAGR